MTIEHMYENLGISKEVLAYGKAVEESLKERFLEIDANAEYTR